MIEMHVNLSLYLKQTYTIFLITKLIRQNLRSAYSLRVGTEFGTERK